MIKKMFLIAPLIVFSFIYAVITYSGNDYLEKLLPLTDNSTSAIYRVVIGNTLSLTDNTTSAANCATFTINGTNYRGSGNVSVTSAGDDRYFIVYDGKNGSPGFTLVGTNDWITNQTHTPISLPYSQTGTTSAFYETAADAKVDSVVSSGLDMLLINNADYTNLTVTTLPARQNNKYYIYYGSPASGSPSLSVTPYTPELNIKVFLEGAIW